MYIAINSIDNGFMVKFTKCNREKRDFFGITIERYFPTAEAVQAELLKLIQEAT